MPKRSRLAGILLAAPIFVAGCQTASKPDTSATTRPGDDAVTPPSVSAPKSKELPPPPGLEAKFLAPRTGDAAVKARMPLEGVLSLLPTPEYLKTPTTQPAPRADKGLDPIPLAAQKAYMAGRMAWKQRMPFEATQKLDEADRLAPNTPEILQLLGEIYTITGNRTRGTYYLEQSVAIAPDDVQSLYMLGRHALDQGKPATAIVLFSRVISLREKSPDVDPGYFPMSAFFLANALDREGYDAAAVQQFTQLLEAPPTANRTTRLVRELTFLSRERAVLLQAVGDAKHRLDDPKGANKAYREIPNATESPDPLLTGRLVYTDLRLNNVDDAEQLAIGLLKRTDASQPALAMVRYVAAQGSDAKRFASRIRKIYDESDRSSPLAITIADLLGPSEGRVFLQNHLAAKPQDKPALVQLLTLTMADKSASPSPQALTVRTVMRAIEASPASARDYAGAMMESQTDLPGLLAGFDALPKDEREKPAGRFVHGCLLAATGANEDAIPEFEAVTVAKPELQAARLYLARLLAGQNQFDRAEEVLAPLATLDEPEVVALRVQVLKARRKNAEALALVESMLTKTPGNVELLIQKADLQLAANDAPGAERTLLDALDSKPNSEPLYDALFTLYDTGAVPDAVQQYQRLMRRMLSTIPNSRVARLKRAELAAANQEFDQAEKLLRGLLGENPRDYKAINELAQLFEMSNRPSEARAMLEDRVSKSPNDSRALLLLLEHFKRVRDQKMANQTLERLLMLEPAGQARAVSLARLYLQQNRNEDAVKVIDEALAGKVSDVRDLGALLSRALQRDGKVDEAEKRLRELSKRFPKQEPELLLQVGLLYERRGKREEADKVMLEILEKAPDHAATNNSLGYSWADRGINLDKAKKMIQSAVDAEPDSAAYLDSLGWVYYKLGDYENAVKWLRRAVAAPGGDYPVIHDHLGDAYYRNEKKTQAVESWRRATTRMQGESAEDDPELAGLDQRLKQKIEAVARNAVPKVADVPGKPLPAAPAPPANAPKPPAASVEPKT